MYINLEQLALSGLRPYDLVNLVAIRQKDDFYVKSIPEEDLNLYLAVGYTDMLKNGSYKLTKKGIGLLVAIESPGLTDEILETEKAAIEMYEKEGKEIGVSVKEVESRLVWFMGNTAFKKNVVLGGIAEYLAASDKYTLSLCNLIWKPPSVAFSVHKNLKDSKLFDIIARKFNFDPGVYFNEDKNKELEWLFAVSRLPNPPAKSNPDVLFTFDVKKEKERLLNIKTYLSNYLKKSFR